MNDHSAIESNDYKRKLFERLYGISSKFKIPYPINQKLSYDYPKINPIICQNIINCLIKYPKFYEQTLHLMNKMNLPCPLYPYIREPCNIQSKFDKDDNLENFSSESEIESEPEINSKRKKSDVTNEQFKNIKVKSILKSINFACHPQKTYDLNQIFEKAQENISQTKIKIQLKDKGNELMAVDYEQKNSNDNKDNGHSEMLEKESDSYIKKKDLENNRIKLSELEQLSIFKNYEKGDKNSRIYLKNLSKKVTEADLKFIYGRYVDWTCDIQKNAFSIRLMKEGRMKGQAFINFFNEDIAEKAIDETLGYVLDSKPIIVQFSRSTKKPT